METVISNGIISATIRHHGAELALLMKNGKNYIWTVERNFWDKTSPVLFPIVGGLKNGIFEHEGKTYALPRHGFARDCTFELLCKSNDAAVFCLKSTPEAQ